jgi:hypothetical protein
LNKEGVELFYNILLLVKHKWQFLFSDNIDGVLNCTKRGIGQTFRNCCVAVPDSGSIQWLAQRMVRH